jgi:sugar phosphate isomerase/epimerase
MSRALTRREFSRAVALAASAAAARVSWAAQEPRFRLGLVTYNVARDWALETLLRSCREAGFEGVEFRTTHAHGVERTLSAAQRQTVRAKCRDAGLKQLSLGTVCEFHSPDPAVVRKNVEDCRGRVLLAKDLGARGVKVRPNGLPKEVPEEKTVTQIGAALAECGRFATDHGVEIWCEVHGDQTKLPPRMRAIMDACGHPSVGVTWNSNDTDVVNGSIAPSFELLKSFIRCCHITDLGSGYPYRELFAKLAGTGFEGFTLCEFPQPVAAADGVAWLREYRQTWEGLRRPA